MRAFFSGAVLPVRGAILSILFPVAAGLLFSVPSLAQGGGSADDDDDCPYDSCVTESFWDAEFIDNQMGALTNLVNDHNSVYNYSPPAPEPCYGDCLSGGATYRGEQPMTDEDREEVVDTACDVVTDLSAVNQIVEGVGVLGGIGMAVDRDFRQYVIGVGRRLGTRALAGPAAFAGVEIGAGLCALR